MFKGKKFSRSNTWIRLSVSEHFAKYKWFYVIFTAICLTGLIAGFVIGFGKESISIDDLPDNVLVSFINKDITASSIFFSRFFAFLGLLILIWITNCKPFLSFVSFLILLYRAFLIGINSAMLIILYQVGGVINVVLIFLPVHLISLFAIIMWASVCFYFNLANKRLGYSVLSVNFISEKKGNFIVACMIAFLSYLLEAILLPYLTSTVFIGA